MRESDAITIHCNAMRCNNKTVNVIKFSIISLQQILSQRVPFQWHDKSPVSHSHTFLDLIFFHVLSNVFINVISYCFYLIFYNDQYNLIDWNWATMIELRPEYGWYKVHFEFESALQNPTKSFSIFVIEILQGIKYDHPIQFCGPYHVHVLNGIQYEH